MTGSQGEKKDIKNKIWNRSEKIFNIEEIISWDIKIEFLSNHYWFE